MLKPKLPALLNGVRILLSFKIIFYIITFIVFVAIFSRNPDAYLDPPITGSDLGDVSAELTARIMFWVIPSLLAVFSITQRKFKSTVTFLSIALFMGVLNEGLIAALIQLYALLVVLLHRPSKKFLKRQDSVVTETKYVAKKSLT